MEINFRKIPIVGGFYKRLIGITKICLKKRMGNSKLTYNEIVTFSIEVECIIKSRSLTYAEDDLNNDVLTAIQFSLWT